MNVRSCLVTFAAAAAAMGFALTGCTNGTDATDDTIDTSTRKPAVIASKDTTTPVLKEMVDNPTKPCDAMSAKKLNELLGGDTYGEGRMEDLGSYALVTDMSYDPRECTYTNKDGNTIRVSTRFGYQSLCGTETCTYEHPYKELQAISLKDYTAMAKTVNEYQDKGQQTLSLRPNGDDEVVGAEFASLHYFDAYGEGTCVTKVCKAHIAADFMYSYETPKGNVSSLIIISGSNISQPQILEIMEHAVRTDALFPEEVFNN